MKNLSKKILVSVFIGFLSLSLLFTPILNYSGMIGSLYEQKDQLLHYKTTFSTVSSAFSGNLILLHEYSDLYGGLQRAQSKNAVWTDSARNSLVIGSDGKLYDTVLFQKETVLDEIGLSEDDRATIAECKDALTAFAKEANERNAEFFFAQAPARYDSDYVSLPIPQNSTRAKVVDALADSLGDEALIHVLNFQQYFHDEGIPFDSWFYRTDHHWTTQMAFLAFQKLCAEIVEETDIEIDKVYYSAESWKSETVEKSFVGSRGEKAGALFVEKDDFDYIYPIFDTDYDKELAKNPYVSISAGGSVAVKGNYTTAVLDMHQKTISNGAYIGGDICEARLKNTKAASNQKILVIKDSFALPVSAFLSTCFSETRLLDLRYFQDDLMEYLDSYQPDIILVLYNPNSYTDTFFDFQ